MAPEDSVPSDSGLGVSCAITCGRLSYSGRRRRDIIPTTFFVPGDGAIERIALDYEASDREPSSGVATAERPRSGVDRREGNHDASTRASRLRRHVCRQGADRYGAGAQSHAPVSPGAGGQAPLLLPYPAFASGTNPQHRSAFITNFDRRSDSDPRCPSRSSAGTDRWPVDPRSERIGVGRASPEIRRSGRVLRSFLDTARIPLATGSGRLVSRHPIREEDIDLRGSVDKKHDGSEFHRIEIIFIVGVNEIATFLL